MRASVPPLSGVFQQSIARRAKRFTPSPMHAPAISAHHEGNSFDLLFLVQAPNSFLFYMQLVSSNCLSEEKAGHLYAVCLKFAAWRRYTLRLRRNVWQHRLQPYAHLFFGVRLPAPPLSRVPWQYRRSWVPFPISCSLFKLRISFCFAFWLATSNRLIEEQAAL